MFPANDRSGSVHEAQIVLGNDVAELKRLAVFVQKFVDDAKLAASIRLALDLAVTEWVTNILAYGFSKSEAGTITVELCIHHGAVRATVEDTAKPFNPLEHPEVDTTVPLEEKPIGGLGIHLVRKFMDEVFYERHLGGNRLVMSKSLANGAPPTEAISV
jgi:anti-sigma regulatory factor (Ser/Thr protein kinase)